MAEPALHDLTDAELVARCRAGDAAAWNGVVERYQRLVLAVIRRAGHDEHGAADLFQTVFARLVEHLHTMAQPDRLQAWLVTTAKREAVKARVRGARTVSLTPPDDDTPSLADTLVDEGPLAEDALSDLQQLERLRQAMLRMDERCRQLLALVFRDDDEALSYDEIARQTGLPRGSLGPTRARCLDKLRRFVVAAGGVAS